MLSGDRKEDPLIGKILWGYSVERRIGGGGFGDVYEGRHIDLKNRVAIKVLHADRPSSEDQARFFDEAKVLSQLDHPHILPLLTFFKEQREKQEVFYIIMKYASGGSLADRLKKHRKLHSKQPLPLQEAFTILWQVGQALHYAHHQQPDAIVHRDLKPANILFNNRDDALLADFGLASLLQEGETISVDKIAGSPDYMAPEQFAGYVSVKSDQYALGCIAYELFTGRHPFPVDGIYDKRQIYLALQYQHTTIVPESPLKLNPQLPVAISDAILKALAKERDQRHDDVLSFVEILRQGLDKGTTSRPSSVPQKSFEEWYMEGSDLYKRGLYRGAIGAYQQATRLKPDFAETYTNMGIAYYNLKEYDKAIMAFEQAIHHQSDHIKSHYHKGLCLTAEGQHEQAIAAYQTVIQLNPNHPRVYQNLGDAFYACSKWKEAVDAYKQAIRLDSNDARIYNNLGNALRQCHENVEAIKAFERAIELDPKLIEAYYNLGNTLTTRKQYQEAVINYECAIEIKPDYAQAYIAMSKVLRQLGRPEMARRAEEKARELGYSDV